MNRIVIIGNCGSGKTFLAHRLAAPRGLEVHQLDEMRREPGAEFGTRPCASVLAEIEQIKQGENWVVEGVHGELAELFLDRADYLVWLDLAWIFCRDGLVTRGPSILKYGDPAHAETEFQNLLIWTENYWKRTDSCSHAGHQDIFERFPGEKDRILFRDCAEALFEDW